MKLTAKLWSATGYWTPESTNLLSHLYGSAQTRAPARTVCSAPSRSHCTHCSPMIAPPDIRTTLLWSIQTTRSSSALWQTAMRVHIERRSIILPKTHPCLHHWSWGEACGQRKVPWNNHLLEPPNKTTEKMNDRKTSCMETSQTGMVHTEHRTGKVIEIVCSPCWHKHKHSTKRKEMCVS